MAGGQDNKRRFDEVRAVPEGEQHYLDPAVRVRITMRISPPPLDFEVDGFAVAWTRAAVHCIWRDVKGVFRTGWIHPEDVERR